MKKRNFLSCLLIIAIVLATISPTVLFAAEDIAQDEQVYDETYTEETEEYVEETPEAYDWTIETNELKKWPQGPRVEAEGATVMDLDTGAFLYSKNAEAKLYPASITKIMTMLVALEHISDSDLDTKVKASESALAPIDSDSSQIWLSVGEKRKIWEKYYQGEEQTGHSGLGLYIVKTVITMHGGTYGVDNRENGVCFWFSLPLV